jgi:hypothetical protein
MITSSGPQGDKPCPVTYQPGAWLAQLPAEPAPAVQDRPQRSGDLESQHPGGPTQAARGRGRRPPTTWPACRLIRGLPRCGRVSRFHGDRRVPARRAGLEESRGGVTTGNRASLVPCHRVLVDWRGFSLQGAAPYDHLASEQSSCDGQSDAKRDPERSHQAALKLTQFTTSSAVMPTR